MRKFKFRVWDKTRKEMWHLSESPMTSISLQVNNQHWGLFDGIEHICGSASSSGVLMQSTGLTDSKDKLIYEGDIVKYKWYDEYILMHIRYKDGEFIAQPNNPSKNFWDIRIYSNNKRFKVVGNVFELKKISNKNIRLMRGKRRFAEL